MNRADLLLHVLSDGEPHSRQDIQRRVGFFLTNNAASELRKRNLNIVRTNEGRTVYYQLLPLSPLVEPTGTSSSLDELVGSVSGFGSQSGPGRTSRADGNASGNGGRLPDSLISSEQLSLIEAA